MSAPARARSHEQHIHLPSVHSRDADGDGFNYTEDVFLVAKGRREVVTRVVRLALVERDREVLVRETRDQLCEEDIDQLRADLLVLMDETNPAAQPVMEECARNELARQTRIAAGEELACAACGCSETRACSGGCIWVTATLCSRCA